MDIAVVIPLYNGASWIRKTLESVFSQSRCPSQVIVVDDGSTDDSVNIVREFSGITLLFNPSKGANPARVFGLKHTNEPLVALLDQDDIWHCDHLRLLSNILERNSDCPAAIAGTTSFTLDDQLIFQPPALNPVLSNPWSSFPLNGVGTPSAVLMRRKALDEVGGWTTKFIGVADCYTWFRLSIHKPLIQNQAITVGHRQHHSSYSVVLRVQNAAEYFNKELAALEDALSYRLAVFPADTHSLRRRLETFHAMSGIVMAVTHCNPEMLKSSAITLEEKLLNEVTEFIPIVWIQLNFYLKPLLTTKTLKQRQVVVDYLFEQWPLEAKNTRQQARHYLKQNLSNQSLLQYAWARPRKLQRWALLVDKQLASLKYIVRARTRLKALMQLFPVVHQ